MGWTGCGGSKDLAARPGRRGDVSARRLGGRMISESGIRRQGPRMSVNDGFTWKGGHVILRRTTYIDLPSFVGTASSRSFTEWLKRPTPH